MKLQQLLVFLLVIMSFSLNAQSDSTNTDSLVFLLDVIVKDIKTNKPADNAEVKIIGTNGTSNSLITDEYGQTKTFSLEKNTNYSIIISKKPYRPVHGIITTIGETQSKHFVHEYEIEVFRDYRVPLYGQYFKHDSIVPYKAKLPDNDFSGNISYEYYYQVFRDKPTLTVEITGYRDSDEKKEISKKRAQKFADKLIEMGIEKDCFLVKDGGIRSYKIYRDTGVKHKEELKQENRIITFKVLSTDIQNGMNINE